jgi:NAD(P)-dependent dehydrogenase (short-subunit alcohol dehydrogenase family)
VNLTGYFLMAKHAAPLLRKSGGCIVNMASSRAYQSEADTEAYAASKGGIVALTHALSISLGPDVRVNAVAPGWIDVRDEQPGEPDPAPLRELSSPARRWSRTVA